MQFRAIGVYYLFDADEVYIMAFWCSKEDIPVKMERRF
jgi:hypothetical protein